MEFLLGSIFTLILLSAIRMFILKSDLNKRYAIKKILYTQSHIYRLVGYAISQAVGIKDPIDRQSSHLLNKNQIKVVFADNHAYWIKDNNFYQASVINGKIDNSTTKIVDTMGMDRVELDKMFFIVQKLTEGNNHDGGNSGVKDL
jgi:hypothetical protein